MKSEVRAILMDTLKDNKLKSFIIKRFDSLYDESVSTMKKEGWSKRIQITDSFSFLYGESVTEVIVDNETHYIKA